MNWIWQNQFFILLGLLVAGFMISAWYLFNFKKKIRLLFEDGDGLAEELPPNIMGQLTQIKTKIKELERQVELMEKISQISIQKVGFLRFNPFQDIGGNQSFILALLDRENTGVLLTSLYTRQGIRLYAKEIKQGKAKQQLSEEENQVLQEAVGKNQKSEIPTLV